MHWKLAPGSDEKAKVGVGSLVVPDGPELIVVWGGVDRLRFHGVMPLKDLPHPRLGSVRINFTLRKAG